MEKKSKYNLSKLEYNLSKDSDRIKKELIPNPPAPKKPWWPWVLGVIVVCGGLIILLTRGNNTTVDEIGQSTEQVAGNVTHQNNSTTIRPVVSDIDEATEDHPSTQNETTKTATQQSDADKTTARQQTQGVSSSQQKTTQKSETSSSTSTTQNNTTTSSDVTSTTANGTVEEEAWRTIRGDYGNGLERKEALGSRYDEIQSKVNEFYREGKVH